MGLPLGGAFSPARLCTEFYRGTVESVGRSNLGGVKALGRVV